MSAQPVTLDMSTAQPIQAAPVKLDMSTAQAIDRPDADKPSAASRLGSNFLSGIGVTSNEQAKNFFVHPLDTVIKSFEAQGELAKKAKQAYDRGDYMEALQHGLNYMVPFIGQQTDQAGTQLKEGDIAGGVGRTLGAAVPIVAGSPKVQAAASDVAAAAAERGAQAIRASARGANVALAKAPGTIGGAAGAAAGGYVGGHVGAEIGGVAGAMAGRELLPQVRIPGEGFGLPSRVTGGPASAPPYTGTFPGAPYPEHPGVFPGAPLPEAPPAEVAQASSLARGPQPVVDPAQGLGQIPSRYTPPTQTPAEPVAVPSKIKPSVVEQQLEESLGGQKLVPGVPLRGQAAAQAAEAAKKLPAGFTPVESSAIKGYKYDPKTLEFESITQGGQHYIHGDVTPDQAAKFEASDSKGKAWGELRNAPGVTPVAKVINGKRISTIPVRRFEPEEEPETPSKPPTTEDLSAILQESLKRARAQRASQ